MVDGALIKHAVLQVLVCNSYHLRAKVNNRPITHYVFPLIAVREESLAIFIHSPHPTHSYFVLHAQQVITREAFALVAS